MFFWLYSEIEYNIYMEEWDILGFVEFCNSELAEEQWSEDIEFIEPLWADPGITIERLKQWFPGVTTFTRYHLREIEFKLQAERNIKLKEEAEYSSQQRQIKKKEAKRRQRNKYLAKWRRENSEYHSIWQKTNPQKTRLYSRKSYYKKKLQVGIISQMEYEKLTSNQGI